MKRIVLMFALALMATVTALAQDKKMDAPKPAADLPKAEEILDKYVKALGGKEAIQKEPGFSADLARAHPAGDIVDTTRIVGQAAGKFQYVPRLPGGDIGGDDTKIFVALHAPQRHSSGH